MIRFVIGGMGQHIRSIETLHRSVVRRLEHLALRKTPEDRDYTLDQIERLKDALDKAAVIVRREADK